MDLTLITVWNGVSALGGTRKKVQGFYFITIKPRIMAKHSTFNQKCLRKKSLIFNIFLLHSHIQSNFFRTGLGEFRGPGPSIIGWSHLLG
jgi:hypothetical protein